MERFVVETLLAPSDCIFFNKNTLGAPLQSNNQMTQHLFLSRPRRPFLQEQVGASYLVIICELLQTETLIYRVICRIDYSNSITVLAN